MEQFPSSEERRKRIQHALGHIAYQADEVLQCTRRYRGERERQLTINPSYVHHLAREVQVQQATFQQAIVDTLRDIGLLLPGHLLVTGTVYRIESKQSYTPIEVESAAFAVTDLAMKPASKDDRRPSLLLSLRGDDGDYRAVYGQIRWEDPNEE